jgi:hypothetical protein
MLTLLPAGQLLPVTVMSRDVRMCTVVGVIVIEGLMIGLGLGE